MATVSVGTPIHDIDGPLEPSRTDASNNSNAGTSTLGFDFDVEHKPGILN